MANKVQCTGGHWFDLSKFRFCPYCGLPAAVAVQAPVQPAAPVMPPMPPAQPMMPPMPPVQNGYYSQTQTIYPAPAPAPFPAPAPAPVTAAPAAKPPVGWLVGTSGPAKGKTYVIREGKNFVGSAPDMDIVLVEGLNNLFCELLLLSLLSTIEHNFLNSLETLIFVPHSNFHNSIFI